MPKPFLMWAGGKRWIVDALRDLPIPTFTRYIEPFLGSGSVFFNLNPEEAVLSDLNRPLIDTYRAIRDDWKAVVRQLQWHQERHSFRHYYEVRSAHPVDKFARAARFIYLNRTCWNGLYRVNQAGVFNVPIGTKTEVIGPEENFEEVAHSLESARLHSGDFSWAILQARKGDLIYADPPYTINHDKNGFLKYNQRLFAWEDQIRLKTALLMAMSKGASVIVSNAHHESIRKLYTEQFTLIEVQRFSRISGTNKGRRAGCEYLIKGEPK